MGMAAQDIANVMITNMVELRGWMGNVELVKMELDQWVTQLEWDMANACQDIAMLVSEQEQIRDVVVEQMGLIHQLTNFIELIYE